MQESGLAGYDMSAWFALLAPAGTPPAVVKQLQDALQQTLRTPEVDSTMAGLGMVPRPSTAEDLRARLASELKTWGKVVQDAGIKAD